MNAPLTRLFCNCCLVAMMALISSRSCDAQSTGKYETSGGSGSSWSGSWTETNFCHDIEGFAPAPPAVEEYTVEFGLPKLDVFGNRCTLEGRIGYITGEEKKVLPVNWFQGITVFLALNPEAAPDWSIIENREQSLYESVVINNDGTFSATLDLRETKRNPGMSQEFQVGISIAETKAVSKSGKQNLAWRENDPLVGDSIRFITIPESAEIATEIRLIDQACKWPFEDRDGTKLIRAVNALQPLGKDKALAALRYYLENQSDPYAEDNQIVFWIIRTLFEPVNLQQRIPPPMISVYHYRGDIEQSKFWPISPIEIVDGIPFMLGHRIVSSGSPEEPDSHMAWAKIFGVIRDQRLSPTSSPIAAAEKLLRSNKFQSLSDDHQYEIKLVRAQALSMLADNNRLKSDFGSDDADWQQRLKSHEASQVWNSEKQSFEASARQDEREIGERKEAKQRLLHSFHNVE